MIVNPAVLSLAAEMVLDEAIRNYRIDTLHKKIDHALEHGDRLMFDEATSKLKSLIDESSVRSDSHKYFMEMN
ncbi:IDEAL domain-containing protein [Aneurinibacillus soli]|uniref:Uncharacterized protein n=1 Tax=Aneurinibacillus soli TaxID=1500254 RepID=A0A0U5C7J7_9BACL|nr:IDEAL domain-containing protein [Aneurinibacillus soli]PYE64246.1 IDEAL domain-containing protein [Aneurinibacillus soli]BAU28195.1 hypothetical protein CB4_02369 [Aneurinibacillus soli]